MVIAVAFFKRIFTRSLPTNQAHGLIIAEVCGSRCVSMNTTFAQPRLARGDASFARGLAKIRKFTDGRSSVRTSDPASSTKCE
jgi:hypothetical protein